MTPLLPWLFGFLLVLCRTGGLIMVAPMFSAHTVPARIRSAIAVALSFTAYSGAGFPTFAAFNQLDALVVSVLAESLVGLSAGFAMRMAIEAARGAGHLAGLSMGLGFGSMVDPVGGAESTAIAELLGLLALGAMILAGGHREIILWLSRSLMSQPIGGDVELRPLALNVINAGVGGIALAVRLAFPVMASVLVGQVLLGILSRSAPQLNIGAVGFSVTILTGGAILYMCVPVVAEIASRQATAALSQMH